MVEQDIEILPYGFQIRRGPTARTRCTSYASLLHRRLRPQHRRLVRVGAIRGNKIAYAAVKNGAMMNVSRWFKYVNETNSWIATAVQSANAQAQAKKATKSSEGASYDIALHNTEKGVVTRFPPEPS